MAFSPSLKSRYADRCRSETTRTRRKRNRHLRPCANNTAPFLYTVSRGVGPSNRVKNRFLLKTRNAKHDGQPILIRRFYAELFFSITLKTEEPVKSLERSLRATTIRRPTYTHHGRIRVLYALTNIYIRKIQTIYDINSA